MRLLTAAAAVVCAALCFHPVLKGEEGPLRASVLVNANQTIRPVNRNLFGTNVEWIFSGYGLWNPTTNAAEPEVQRLARDLKLSIVRFPSAGDDYHWQTAIGPVNTRPLGITSGGSPSLNNFGTDEALSFADSIGARLLITVNIRTGTPSEAAEWVRYVNKQGVGRRVTYWELGNEPYLTWGTPMNPADYAQRVVQYAAAMKAVDPGIKIVAVGGENYGRLYNVYPGWNQTLLQVAGRSIDVLAVHNSYMPVLLEPGTPDVRTVYRTMLASTQLIRANLKTLAAQIATYVPPQEHPIKIAVTEWGPLFHVDPAHAYVDHVKTLSSALYVGSLMNAFLSSPETELSASFKLVDNSFMGWIALNNGVSVPKAPYYALQMYGNSVEALVVDSQVASPAFSTAPLGVVDAVKDAPYLDVLSSRSEDGKKLTVLVVNKNLDNEISTDVALAGFTPSANASVKTLNGRSIDANAGPDLPSYPGLVWGQQAVAAPDGRFYLGAPSEIGVTASTLTVPGASFRYTFPAHSITAISFTAQ